MYVYWLERFAIQMHGVHAIPLERTLVIGSQTRLSTTVLDIFLDEKQEPVFLLPTFEAKEEINQALSNTAEEQFAADPFWYDDSEAWAQAKTKYTVLAPYSNQDLRDAYLKIQVPTPNDLLLKTFSSR